MQKNGKGSKKAMIKIEISVVLGSLLPFSTNGSNSGDQNSNNNDKYQ